MAPFANAHGVKPAARHCGTSVKAVRKWLRRGRAGTLQGLDDHSRAPNNLAQRILPEQSANGPWS